jgi:hypothetical protein
MPTEERSMQHAPNAYLPTQADIDCSAFNAAFHELGLRWHWDEDTYEQLAAEPCERNRLRQYLQRMQPHLLRAYDAEFLTDAILAAKQRALRQLTARPAPRPHRFDWAAARAGDSGF